ncbi:DUF262 domain-containing protein [Methanohalobium evestigatum]|uniref:DUF262 domain-containing protein n=1 Tax=Methanohalobium evestigatum TaxID=2322 RepID=UPI000ADFEBBE|nr:DUF262 domain-containing protein [Methanohalobium evestigatum]
MKAGEINLHKFLEGQKQFIVPIYQRTYSWNENHCQKLWEDIERLLNGQYQSHFLGSIVYINSDIYQISTITKLHVIDGQQRLTTISLLLQALREAIKNNSDQVKGINSRKIKNYYLLNQDEEDELRYKLVLNRNDNDTYVNILENNEIQNDYSPNIIKNYYFFKNKITEYAPENLE